MRFDTFTILLLTRPDDAPDLRESELDAIQDAHLAHQAELHDRGILIAAGPFADQDDERFRGLSVLSVEPEEARRLYATDPAVRTGRLAVQVMTWMVPAGNVRFEDVPHPRSMSEADDE